MVSFKKKNEKFVLCHFTYRRIMLDLEVRLFVIIGISR